MHIISASLKIWVWSQQGHTHIFDAAPKAPLLKCWEITTAADISSVQLYLYEKFWSEESHPIVLVTLLTPKHLDKINKMIYIPTFCVCDPDRPTESIVFPTSPCFSDLSF